MIAEKAKNRHVFFVYGGTDVEIRESVREITEKENNAIIVASYGNVPKSIDLFAFRAHLETWQMCRPVGRRSFVQLLRMKCRLLQMKSLRSVKHLMLTVLTSITTRLLSTPRPIVASERLIGLSPDQFPLMMVVTSEDSEVIASRRTLTLS
jgi:hypothetical protein